MKRTKPRLLAAGLLGAVAMAGVTVGSVAYAAGDSNQVVTIDAAKDPTAATNAMNLLPTATDTDFTPTGNPAYSQTGWVLASTSSINNPPGSSSNLIQTVKATHTAGASVSIGGSVGASFEVSALDIVKEKVSVEFSAEHQWTNETSDSEEVLATAIPGKVVWVVASHGQATFTGDYTFTVNGITYHVNNVTITEPAPAPGGDTTTGTTYMVVERPYSQVNNLKTLTGSLPKGLVPIAKTPQLARITAQLPKLPY
jgi:hypothetical protein